ncbi:hypothetical protein MKX01_027594 [Papaver californicum]|nr:hypothetical protein MKX01_027594 [Papaver californicum]
MPVYGLFNTSCITSMLSGFTPCLNYITQSSGGNGSTPATPSSECCSSLKSIANSGMNCACLIVTGNVPPESIPTLESPPVDLDSPTTSFTGTRPVVDPSSAAKVFLVQDWREVVTIEVIYIIYIFSSIIF